MNYKITIKTNERRVLAQLLKAIDDSMAVEYDITVNTDEEGGVE